MDNQVMSAKVFSSTEESWRMWQWPECVLSAGISKITVTKHFPVLTALTWILGITLSQGRGEKRLCRTDSDNKVMSQMCLIEVSSEFSSNHSMVIYSVLPTPAGEERKKADTAFSLRQALWDLPPPPSPLAAPPLFQPLLLPSEAKVWIARVWVLESCPAVGLPAACQLLHLVLALGARDHWGIFWT